jgi:ribosome maturation factor RimP
VPRSDRVRADWDSRPHGTECRRTRRAAGRQAKVQSEELREEIEPLLSTRGYSVVEVTRARRRESVVALADCGTVSKILKHHPAIAPLLDDADLEVCSPGVNRKIRASREYDIFRGRGVRLLLRSTGEWMSGRIHGADGDGVTVEREGQLGTAAYDDIRRAFLDATQEVRS